MKRANVKRDLPRESAGQDGSDRLLSTGRIIDRILAERKL